MQAGLTQPLREVQHIFELSRLPPHLRSLFREAVELKERQSGSFPGNLLNSILVMHAGARPVCQQTQDPSLVAARLITIQAEMQAAVAVTRAAMAAGVCCNLRMLTEATLEHMQLSQAQQAVLVQKGLALFAKQRALTAERNALTQSLKAVLRAASRALPMHAALDPVQLASLRLLMDTMLRIRESDIQSCAQSIVQLCCDQALSDEQFLRMQSRAPEVAVLPSVHLMLVVLCDAWLKPRAPRLPSLRSSGQALKRARSTSPGHGRRCARRLTVEPDQCRPQQTADHVLPGSLLQQADELAAPASWLPPDTAVQAPSAAHVPSAVPEHGPSQAPEHLHPVVADQQPKQAVTQHATALQLPRLRELLTEMSLLNELPLPRACSHDNMAPQGMFASLHEECWDESEPPSASPSAQHPAPQVLLMTSFSWHNYDFVSQPASSAASVADMEQAPPELMQHAGRASSRQPQTAIYEPQAEGPCQWDYVTPSNMRAYGIVDLLSEAPPTTSNVTISAACSSSEH